MSKQVKIPVAIIGKNFGLKVLSKALIKTKKFDLKAISFKSKNFEKTSDRRIFFSSNWKDVINLQKNQPILFEANKQFSRNEGASMSEGIKLITIANEHF